MFLNFLLLPTLFPLASDRPQVSNLPTIQARWDASDLVCIGEAEPPQRTGIAEFINGASRDQLSTNVVLERCFKGENPNSSGVRVLGNYVAAAKPGDIGVISFAYSGPPLGFVHNGRNLLFLRRTSVPNEFSVTVPIYETAIPLADVPPDYPSPFSPAFMKTVVTRELESAMLQSEETGRDMDLKAFADPLLSDYRYIDYMVDYLGTIDGIAELSRFLETAPIAIQRDIAIRLLDLEERRGSLDQSRYQSFVIDLMLDKSAPAWKRENAARALGRHGSQAALDPLREVASEPAGTEELKMLHNEAASALTSLMHRVNPADR